MEKGSSSANYPWLWSGPILMARALPGSSALEGSGGWQGSQAPVRPPVPASPCLFAINLRETSPRFGGMKAV